TRPSRRTVARAFFDGLRFRQQSMQWSDGQKREWILRRLRSVVRAAAKDTDYYRNVFRYSGFDPNSEFTFRDFYRLPVLEREDISRAGKTILATSIPFESLKRDSTGGSTGEPTVVWLGPEEQGWRESSIESFMRRIDAPSGTRTAFLWGHHLDPVNTDN